MAATEISGRQIRDGSVQRKDLDITTTGQAVIRKIVAGSGISLSWNGADSGTGDVTITASGAAFQANDSWIQWRDSGNISYLNTFKVDGSNNLLINADAATGAIYFQLAQNNALALTNSSNFRFYATNFVVQGNSVDNSDNQSITFTPANATGAYSTRGADIQIFGNEHVSNPGKLVLEAGDKPGSNVVVNASATNGSVQLQVAGSDKLVIGASNIQISSQLQLASGSAAAPALFFAGSSSTGIFSPAANSVAISVSGTEAVRLNSSANLGVGVSPSVRLHVNADTAQEVARFDTTGATQSPYVSFYGNGSRRGYLQSSLSPSNRLTLYADNDLILQAPSTVSLQMTTGSANRFLFDNTSGTITIGNTSWASAPASNLLVATSASTNKGLIVKGSAGQSANLFEVQDSSGNALVSVDSAGAFTLSNQLIKNVASPVSANDVATKAYVDAITFPMDVKNSCRVATTSNITLSGTQTIDGVAVVAGDRVLVKNQSTGTQNGIYVVASGAWSRAADADSSAEVTANLFVFVSEGSTQADTQWVLTTNDPITLGTTALTFAQFGSSPGSGIATLNSLSTTAQSFATSNAGTDFTISSSGSTHTFGLPDASASARGLINFSSQTISGSKTFDSDTTISSSGATRTLSLTDGTITAQFKVVNGDKVYVGPFTSHSLGFQTGGTQRWSINPTGGLLQDSANGGDIFFNRANSSLDASASASNFSIKYNASNALVVSRGSNAVWSFDSSGNLSQDGTNGGDLVFNKAGSDVVSKVVTGVSAAGTTQSTATAITATRVEVTTATGGSADSLVLPAAVAGKTYTIFNRTSATIKVFPALGASINSLASNLSISVLAGQCVSLTAVTTTKWYTETAGLSLDDLTDVAITSPTANQVLSYNGTSWVNSAAAATGITSLNSLTSGTQTFAVGTTGSDFNISSSGGTHAFNVPDASATARGAITTGAQTIAGVKTFSSAPNLSSLTASLPLKLDASKNVTTGAINIASGSGEITGSLPIANGGTGATTASGALTNLTATQRSTTFPANNESSVKAADLRTVSNPLTGLGYAAGVRFRFAALNDVSGPEWADVMDLSTYSDSTGGGFNALYFSKNSQLIRHKYAAAGATAWTEKTLAYTNSGSANFIPRYSDSLTLTPSQIYDTGSFVGLGTSSPDFKLTVQTDGNDIFGLRTYNSSDGVVIRGYRAKGSAASPSAILANDTLMGVRAFGYHSGGSFTGATCSINFIAAENFTNIANGTYISFTTTPIGSQTQAERLRINSNGSISHKAHSNYSNSGTERTTAAADTTTNTTATLYSFALADNTLYKFKVEIVGRLNSTTAKGVWGTLDFGVYRNNAGVATLAGTRMKVIDTYGSSGYDFDVDVTGNDVRIRVTGGASETVSWCADIMSVDVSTAA